MFIRVKRIVGSGQGEMAVDAAFEASDLARMNAFVGKDQVALFFKTGGAWEVEGTIDDLMRPIAPGPDPVPVAAIRAVLAGTQTYDHMAEVGRWLDKVEGKGVG